MSSQTTLSKLEKLIEFLKGRPPIYFQKLERMIIVLIIEELNKELYQLGLSIDKAKIELQLVDKRRFQIDNDFEVDNFEKNAFYLIRNSLVEELKQSRIEKQDLEQRFENFIKQLDFEKIKLDWSSLSNFYKKRIDELFTAIKKFDVFSVGNIVTICESIIYRYELQQLKWIQQSSRSQNETDIINNPFYISLVDENFVIPVSFEEYEEDIFEAILKEQNKNRDD